MAKKKATDIKLDQPAFKPAMSPEARENQLIALAYDLVEQRLRDGTATSQETTHFLKLGSRKEKLEEEILQEQKKLMTAKTEALQSSKRVEELISNAMDALKTYGVSNGDQLE